MDADFAVELGADDDALEFPWTSPDGAQHYYDLKRQPDLLLYVNEAADFPELGSFLSAVNGKRSAFLTAKCDTWSDRELTEAEEIYGASTKFGSYVDLLFEGEGAEAADLRFSFEAHERLARRLCELLGLVPEIPATAEFIVRRCYYHLADEPVRPGFYVTVYLYGYGDDESEARKRWGIALALVQNAILQVSAEVLRGKV